MPKARIVYNGDEVYTTKEGCTNKLLTTIEQKIDAIPGVVDNTSSTSTTDALSANQGKILQEQIDALQAHGRFLSLWDCTTGLPVSFPLNIPYLYTTGDYYLIGVVGPGPNYRPSGAQYTATQSSQTETGAVSVGDMYIFDGIQWLLQINHGIVTTFSNIAGSPYDNLNLGAALNSKQNTLSAGANITISGSTISATDTTYSAGTGLSLSGTTFSNAGVTSVNNNTGAVTVSEFTPGGTATTGYVVKKTANGYEWAAESGAVTSVNGNTGAVTVSEFTPSGTATTGYVVTKTANGYEWAAPGGGDVVGPSSAVDGHLAVFDGATGKLIKDGGATPSGLITNDITGTTTTVTKIWAGTAAEYALLTPNASTIYYVF